MTVKDLFNKFNFEDIWDYFYEHYIKNDNDTDEDIENSKLCHQVAFLKIKTIDIEKPDKNNILIGHKIIDYNETTNDNYEYIDASLYSVKEIKKYFKINKEFETNFDFTTLSLQELKDFLRDFREYTSYAYEFTPWKEILSFMIEESSLNDIGELAFISSIFNEMTFLGFDEEDVEEEREELSNRVEEVEKAIATGDNSCFKTWKEVKEELFPDLEMPIITEEEMKKSWLLAIENKKMIYPYLKTIYKKRDF